MGEIHLVRHGQASFGAEDYDALSTVGHSQAGILGRWHATGAATFDLVALGGLKRHRQTADAWATEFPGAPAPAGWIVDRGFDEYDHREMLLRAHPEAGDLAGLQRWLSEAAASRRAFQELFSAAMARWISGRHDGDYLESWAAFRKRCISALEGLVARAGPSRRLIVFTSGGPIAAICQHLLDVPPPQVASLSWSLMNGAVTKLLYQPGRLSLSTLNNHSHLEREGDPALLTYR
ncbi:MAG TPA: histidine phosphatase family protein [Aliidongia sp.]|uniref:histidine phosphatase family protein n=1 Tax=Aliidongia sp. TaxID=1914230 RepID=UPI002DDCB2D5|nr:histidine phosphatase family protein [Aliidongia sp.]HEV2673100.1 histidine phosphatase family protein [Aliidongia sp.]